MVSPIIAMETTAATNHQTNAGIRVTRAIKRPRTNPAVAKIIRAIKISPAATKGTKINPAAIRTNNTSARTVNRTTVTKKIEKVTGKVTASTTV